MNLRACTHDPVRNSVRLARHAVQRILVLAQAKERHFGERAPDVDRHFAIADVIIADIASRTGKFEEGRVADQRLVLEPSQIFVHRIEGREEELRELAFRVDCVVQGFLAGGAGVDFQQRQRRLLHLAFCE